MDKKAVKAIADKEVSAHEKRLYKGQTKFAKGGKTDMDMMKYGRGMAKVMNQKSGRGG